MKTQCDIRSSKGSGIHQINRPVPLDFFIIPKSNQGRQGCTAVTGNDMEMLCANSESENLQRSPSVESQRQLKNTYLRAPTRENPSAKARKEKCFRCPVCDKCFSFLSVALSHQEVHSNSEDLFCRFCTRTFRGSRKLWYHCRKWHADEIDLPSRTSSERVRNSEERGNPCPECDKCFATWRMLRWHQKTAHQTVERYLCEQCAETFTTKGSAVRHGATVHKQKVYPRCELCQKTFSRLDALQRHSKSMHNQCERLH
ncbi:hypothetical protein CRM22_010731 [Opisthorchis felineus]|nr:hypothetical protein CRM22_010731 [Opisthorchis felineus]